MDAEPRRVMWVKPLGGLPALDALLKQTRAGFEDTVAEGTQAASTMLQAPGVHLDAVVLVLATPGPAEQALLQLLLTRHPLVAPLWMGDAAALALGMPGTARPMVLAPGKWEVPQVRAGLERACRLHAVLHNLRGVALVAELDGLPSVPRSYWQLVQAASKPDVSLQHITGIIESDPAMTVRVLQLVNSAFFGLMQRVTSVSAAVAYLGLENIKGLALSAHVFSAFSTCQVRGFSLELFQAYSVRVGRLARDFVKDLGLGEEALTAGIVHDIGKMILAVRRPKELAAVIERVTQHNEPSHLVERELLGVSHAELGAQLLARWGIPAPVVECAAFHHDLRTLPAHGAQLLAAMHAADALVGIVACGEPESALDVHFVTAAGLGDRLPEWRRKVEVERQNWT